MEELNFDELKIMNRLNDSLRSTLDERIEYAVTQKISSIKNWIGSMVAVMVISVITSAFFVGGLVTKVDSFISVQENTNNELRASMLLIPEFKQQLIIQQKNLEFVANELERNDPDFKAALVTRGEFHQQKN